jgi:hypothetical protein
MSDSDARPSFLPPGNRGLHVLEWLLPAACLALMLLLPLTRDSGLFAYAGKVILHGGLPYTDVAEQKGPALYYTYALAIKLFGPTQLGVRAFFAIVALIGARLAAIVAGRLAGHRARLPAALCFALMMVQGDNTCPFFTGQAEDMLAVLTLGVLALLGREEAVTSARRMGIAGVLLALACLYKPTAIVPVAAIAIVTLWQVMRDRTAAKAQSQSAFGAATITFSASLLLAAFAMLRAGFWNDFWEQVVVFNRDTYAPLSVKWTIFGAGGIVAPRLRALIVLGVVWLLWGRNQNVWQRRLVWTALLGHWLAVAWQGRGLPYHWSPMAACLAVVAGCGVATIAERLDCLPWRRVARRVLPAAATIVLPWLAAPANSMYLIYLWRLAGEVVCGSMTRDQFRATFRTGAADAETTRRVAAYVRDHTDPADTVLVWSHEATINFLADRLSPTRFAVDGWLVVASPMQDRWRGEFVAALEASPPRYIVVVEGDRMLLQPEDSMTQMRQFAGFNDLVGRRYAEETRIEQYHLYRLRTGAERQVPVVQSGGGDAQKLRP